MKKAVVTLGSINLVAMEKYQNGCNFMCARRSGNILFYFIFYLFIFLFIFFYYIFFFFFFFYLFTFFFLLTTLLVQQLQNLIKLCQYIYSVHKKSQHLDIHE